jgi:hypothetical protein
MSNFPESPRTFRAAPSTFIVAGIMGAVVVAMMMPSHLSNAKASDWNPPIMFAVLVLLVLLMIRVYKIEISEDSVSYRSPLRGTRTVRYEDIVRVRASITINASTVPTENRAGPMYRLEIYPRATSDISGRVVINMKIFRLEDIRVLLDVLRKKLPDIPLE